VLGDLFCERIIGIFCPRDPHAIDIERCVVKARRISAKSGDVIAMLVSCDENIETRLLLSSFGGRRRNVIDDIRHLDSAAASERSTVDEDVDRRIAGEERDEEAVAESLAIHAHADFGASGVLLLSRLSAFGCHG